LIIFTITRKLTYLNKNVTGHGKKIRALPQKLLDGGKSSGTYGGFIYFVISHTAQG
jgi:hypothetical protein